MRKIFQIYLSLLFTLILTSNTFASEIYNNYYYCDFPKDLVMDRVCTKADATTAYTRDQFYFKCNEDCSGSHCSRGCPEGYRTVEINFINNNRDFFNTLKNGTGTISANINFRHYVSDDMRRCKKSYIECMTSTAWQYDTSSCQSISYPRFSGDIKRQGGLQKRQRLFYKKFLCSKSKKFKLRLNDDGNLCLSGAKQNNGEYFVWCSMVYNYGANDTTNLVMQDDGNLVLYKNGNSDPVWATGTNKTPAYYAELTKDGALVVSDGQRGRWSSDPKNANPFLIHEFTDC